MRKFAGILAVIAVAFAAPIAAAQKDDKPFVLREDLARIGCQVCEVVVGNLHDSVEAIREVAPYKKITELAVLDEIEKVCDTKQPNGWWILQYDIVQQGDELVLEKQDSKGKCEHECLTLQHSCVELLDSDIDQDDLSAVLWKGSLSKDQLQQKVCKQWSGRCKNSKSKHKKPVSQRKDYPFIPLSERDIQMQQLMAAMGDSGMGGFDMMDRESMLEQMANMDPDELAAMYGEEGAPDMFGGMGDGYYDEF